MPRSFVQRSDGIFNVADDDPCSAEEVILYCASLLDTPPPPIIPFHEVATLLPPVVRSFYAENKRARNDKLKRELGVRLIHPTYRDGILALHRAGDE
jgi:hypothetical protein